MNDLSADAICPGPGPEDLAELPLGAIGKYRDRHELAGLCRDLQARGTKVVFTNGCFDLLHIGHVRYLQESAALGNVHVVGLNSDTSVGAIKGPGRPVRSVAFRAEMLAALRCVDYITVFDEPAVTPLLLELKPDIYTKGGDYTLDTIDPTLRDAILTHDIETRFLANIPGVSTTAILEKLNQH